MRSADVAIIGAGLAGSTAAAMLGRAGFDVVLVDPHETCRPDFRCEKLEEPHVAALRKTGLAEDILPSARRYKGIWIARRGRLCENKPAEEYGIDYSALVNRLRDIVPANVAFVCGKVASVALGEERQTLTLTDGSSISARLVVAANGLNAGLLAACGMRRREISRCHSISFGFDVEPIDAERFRFDALTYFGETPDDRVSYITFFPVAAGHRVNLFVFRNADDPWLRRFRDAPESTILECLPRLSRLTGRFRAITPVRPRPVDLYQTENVRQRGIVLVGDAYSTACPTSGTGASKSLVDVERLCNVHIPAWMRTAGMGREKIAAFYDDAAKRRSDRHSFETSLFAKRMALQTGWKWDAYRIARFTGSFARGVIDRPHLGQPTLLIPARP